MIAFVDSIGPVLDRLTQPHLSVADETDRQRSRLLARMLLFSVIAALIVTPFLLVIDPSVDDNPELLVLLVGVLTGLILYAINRRGHVDVAVAGLISLIFGVFTFAPFMPTAATQIMGLAFVPVLLTAIFFPGRSVVLVGLLVLLSTTLLNVTTIGVIFTSSSFAIVLAIGLLITFMHHQQTLETMRHQQLEEANRKLRQSEDRLQQVNAALEQRVEERTRDLAAKNVELSQAWEAAKQADLVKSQFLASMSHELRTPLNSVLNFTEFVNMGMLGPINERQHDALTKALDSGRHLLTLINDVLDITKIEAKMMTLFIEEDIDFMDIVASGVATAQSLLKDKSSVQFISEVEANLPRITADKRRIRQVLLNLLANACKFTEDGSVRLRVKHEGSAILFSISDTGPGIAPEDQTLIFEPFKQTVTGIQHAGGTGLGLPISLRLVEAHHGQLWVESVPNQGATFHVRLPVRAPELLQMLNRAEVATS
ncbi:MAG: hypothetical protein IPO91_10060 [Chloroflexi bacterium]|nr:hypothetical protein [Chloroflexota bacterium]